MDDVAQTTEFGKVLLYGMCGTLLVLFTLWLGKLIAPSNPGKEKQSTYECGEEPQGTAWIQFNARFYLVALVFLLFDVEMVFIFPWATVFGQPAILATDQRWGLFTLLEMFLFVGVLLIGLLYVWKKGDLEWIKPQPQTPVVKVNIPASAYEKLNKEVHVARAFSTITALPEAPAVQPETPKPSTKPAFRPSFRKPGGAS